MGPNQYKKLDINGMQVNLDE